MSGYIKKRITNSKEDHVCIISQHSQFRTKGQFDVLLNKGEGAKLQWIQWEKLIPFASINGAVTTLNGASRVSFNGVVNLANGINYNFMLYLSASIDRNLLHRTTSQEPFNGIS